MKYKINSNNKLKVELGQIVFLNLRNVPIFIALTGFAASIIGFYPGWMSPDSFSQYIEALDNQYTDWHPPMMSIWWHTLLPISNGPLLMLLQNFLFYWAAWALVGLALSKKHGAQGSLATLLGFVPGPFLTFGHIWKDVACAGSFFLAISIIYFLHKTNSPLSWGVRFLIIGLLIYGIGVKTNALTALPVICAYWFYLETKGKPKRLMKIVALTVSAGLGISAVATLVNASVNPRKMDNFQYTQTYDLLGISVKTNHNYLPPYLEEAAKNINIAEYYWPGGNNPFFFTVEGVATHEKSQLEQLRKHWVAAVLAEPAAYMEHRFSNLFAQAWPGRLEPGWVSTGGIDPNPYGIKAATNPLSQYFKALPSIFPLAFHPWIYLGLTLLLGILGYLRKNVDSNFIFAFSIAFYAPHLFILPAGDFRYFVLIYMTSLLLLVVNLPLLKRGVKAT